MDPDVRKVHVYGHGSTVECKHGLPFPSLPSSWIFSGPTCSGKSQAWLSLILRVYRGDFARVYVFSPSIYVDDSYTELRKYLDKMAAPLGSRAVGRSPEWSVATPNEKLYWDDMDMSALGKIIDDQTAICQMCKTKKLKCPEILIVIDDMADRSDVVYRRSGGQSGGSYLTTLAVRGRHIHISWLVTTQTQNLLSPPIRKNVRNLVVYRARSQKEIDCLVEELAAVYDKDTVRALYETAVNDQPYSFLTVKLDANKREDMFWLRWDARLLPEHATNVDVEENNE